MDTTWKTIIWQQFGAAIDMLENALRLLVGSEGGILLEHGRWDCRTDERRVRLNGSGSPKNDG